MAHFLFRSRLKTSWHCAVVLLLWNSPSRSALAQNVPSGGLAGEAKPAEVKSAELTAEEAQVRLKALEQNKDYPEEAKKKLADDYKTIVEQLKLADEFAARIARFQQSIDEAPRILAEKKALLEQPIVDNTLTLPDNAPLAEFERLLSQSATTRLELRKRAFERENDPKRRASRRVEIPKLREDAKNRYLAIQKELDAKAPPLSPAELVSTRRGVLLAKLKATEKELLSYAKEIEYFDATSDTLRVDADLVARELAALEKKTKALQELVNTRRREEAQSQARAAQRAAAGAHPVVKQIAEATAQLAERRSALAAHLDAVSKQFDQLHKERVRLEEQSQKIKKRVEAGGVSGAVGMLLRKQAKELGDTRWHRTQLARRRDEISRVQLELMDHEGDRSDLADLPGRVQQVIETLSDTENGEHVEWLKPAILEALTTQRDYLDNLLKDLQSYFEKLAELDVLETKVTEATDKFADYLAERVLWSPSSAALGREDLARSWQGLVWFLDWDTWGEIRSALWSDFKSFPWLYLVMASVLVVAALGQHRLRRALRRIGDQVAADFTDTFSLTLAAIGITILMASFVPAILAFFAWRLRQSFEAGDFAKGVGHGLEMTAAVVLVVEIFRQLCRPKGVADAHFRWKAKDLRRTRWALYWLLMFEIPLVAIQATMTAVHDEAKHYSLGRLSFMAAMLLLAGFLHGRLRLLAQRESAGAEPALGSWVTRSRFLWHPLAIGLPLVLALITGLGYYDTAMTLSRRLLATLVLVWTTIVLNAVLLRWLYAVRGRLALLQSRLRKNDEEQQPAAGSDPARTALAQSHRVDLSTINAQTRQMLRTVVASALVLGIFCVWADVLPALGVLERVELWRHTVTVAEEVSSPDGGVQVVEREKSDPITLADAALGLVVLAMTFAGARNLPGMLEISLLRRLPLDAGGRYAVATICRYLITLMGVMLAAWAIGIGWNNVQWLFAAFSVGLGFGLQEIFANFISGIILLFERPMRIGDTITVGDMTGVVTRIRIRATTIVEGSRKEIIIPNKEFITGKVVNWTLSDRTAKTTIRVGVAYGSDTAMVETILFKCAADHELVLKESAPSVSFEEFGQSAIHFALTVCVGNIDNIGRVRHELNLAIDKAFRLNGIEFAYPQCDIHVRSIETPLELLSRVTPLRDRRSA